MRSLERQQPVAGLPRGALGPRGAFSPRAGEQISLLPNLSTSEGRTNPESGWAPQACSVLGHPWDEHPALPTPSQRPSLDTKSLKSLSLFLHL